MMQLRRRIRITQLVRYGKIGNPNMSISSITYALKDEGRRSGISTVDRKSRLKLIPDHSKRCTLVDIKKHLVKCSEFQLLANNKQYENNQSNSTISIIRKNTNHGSRERLLTSIYPYEDTTKKSKEWNTLNTKFQTFNSILKAYTEASMSIGDNHNALKKFYHIQLKIGPGTLQISTYHAILKCISRLGDVNELNNIWSIIVDKENLVPDEPCYVYAFQCLGSAKKNNELEVIETAKLIKSSMVTQEMTFDDVFMAGNPLFQGCDRSFLIEGIRILESKFMPKLCLPKNNFYSNSLLSDLDSRDTSNLQSVFSNVKYNGQIKAAVEKQIEMESKGFLQIPSLSSKQLSRDEIEQNKKEISLLCNQWKDILRIEIKRKLEVMDFKRNEKHDSMKNFDVQTFLRVLNVDELSDICLNHVNSILADSSTSGDSTYSPSVSILQRHLGESVMKKYHLNIKTQDQQYMTKYNTAIQNYLEWSLRPSHSTLWCHREAFEAITSEMNDGPALEFIPQDWPFPILIAVGRELLHIIIAKLEFFMDPKDKSHILFDRSSTKKTDRFPVLFRIYLRMRKESHFVEEVKPHPVIAKLFSKQKLHTLRFSIDQLPTLIPPCPWTSPHRGGYYLHPSTLIRVSEEQISPKYKKMIDDRTQNILPVFDSLNILGSTSWMVNKSILEVITKAFVNQEKYRPYLKKMAIPSDPDLVEIPQLRNELKDKLRLKQLSANEKKEYEQYMKEKQMAMQHKSDCNSMWNDIQYRLSIANEFKDEVCFFPHNIDFRGRVYPIPPHLNHMGGDLVRSMFMFAEGKPLGPDGFRWLKLHVINLTGTMKRKSVAERLNYVESILDLIVDSANNPFEGERWWLESEDPFQTLAACFEIRNAIEFAKQVDKSHADYICHLPIHQDGSCNGLQHYAALGRDVLGAASVNLIPADTPQDVYSEIANIVERKRSEDEEAGSEIAKIVKGFVQRKVIKQTVMTTVYGVTKYGAKLQIARQLEDLDAFPRAEKEPASKYLAKLTFESLNEMFHASQEIQAWFIECSNSICGTLNKPVEWTTPLGLPVVQPYMKRLNTPTLYDPTKQKEITTAPLDFRKLMVEKDIREKPNLMKQRNGFPPNFIHSLDSTHMMLTSLYMWNLGVTYASVHDCYWTHPCSVKPMNETCRQQFVRLHSEPILEELAKSFDKNYLRSNSGFNLEVKGLKTKAIPDIEMFKAEKLFQTIPEKGNDHCALNLDIVKKSIYFFS